MTVKNITDQQKDAVALIYRNKSKTILEMAVQLGVSERTIRRILNEKGELAPKPVKAKPLRPVSSVEAVIKLAYMNEEEYERALATIVHTRMAIKYNISVQAAMLKLEQQTLNAGKQGNEQQQSN